MKKKYKQSNSVRKLDKKLLTVFSLCLFYALTIAVSFYAGIRSCSNSKITKNPTFPTSLQSSSSLFYQISPSGKFLYLQGISGGIDTLLNIYSVKHNDTIQLDVLGTSEIFDIKYLPDDRLVVLYGYKGVYKEQYLKIYNLAGLFNKYPANVQKQYKYFIDLNQYSKNITLPDIGKNYHRLSMQGGKLLIYGIKEELLQEYNISSL